MKLTCIIDGCGEYRAGQGFCTLHYYRLLQYGDPNRETQKIAKRGGDPVRYVTMHVRITKARGRAKDHACVDCGFPARDWAYDGVDPDETTDIKDGRVFSRKLEHYIPLCRSCHFALDKDRFHSGEHSGGGHTHRSYRDRVR